MQIWPKCEGRLTRSTIPSPAIWVLKLLPSSWLFSDTLVLWLSFERVLSVDSCKLKHQILYTSLSLLELLSPLASCTTSRLASFNNRFTQLAHPGSYLYAILTILWLHSCYSCRCKGRCEGIVVVNARHRCKHIHHVRSLNRQRPCLWLYYINRSDNDMF